MLLVSRYVLLVFFLLSLSQILLHVLSNRVNVLDPFSVLLLFPRVVDTPLHGINEFGFVHRDKQSSRAISSTVTNKEHVPVSSNASLNSIPLGSKAKVVVPTSSVHTTIKQPIKPVEHPANSTSGSFVKHLTPKASSMSIPVATSTPRTVPLLPTATANSTKSTNKSGQSSQPKSVPSTSTGTTTSKPANKSDQSPQPNSVPPSSTRTPTSKSTNKSSQPTDSHSSSKKPFVKEVYYNWGDSFNYDRMCSALHKAIKGPSAYRILHQGYPGGLGHKYWSLYSAVTYAALLRRRLYIALPLSFWTNTANCITSDQSLLITNVSSLMTGYKRVKKECNYARSLASVFQSRDTVTIDCRFQDYVLGSRSNMRILRKNGIISRSDTYKNYRRRMYRILLNPSIELQQIIQNNKRLLFTRKHVVGVQVRMGGCLADRNEETQMMTMNQLRAYPKTIDLTIRKWGFSPNDTMIYLSTDSTFAEKFIRQKLGSKYEIAVAKTFKRSHSHFLGSDEPVKNALVDLYLLAESDALIVCQFSGFGRAAKLISRTGRVFVYHVSQSYLSAYDPKSGRCK